MSAITIPSFAIAPRDYAKELLDRLRNLEALYSIPYLPDSISPTAKAFEDAKAFVLKLPLNQITDPTINVASDGEVNFDWSNDDYKIDLGFYGNGKYSFYGRSHEREASGDDVSIEHLIPNDLLDLAISK
jgi:hypothetical protein